MWVCGLKCEIWEKWGATYGRNGWGVRLGSKVGEDILEVPDEHAELCAPVANVVDPLDLVADEPEHAAQRVAEDRRAQVPHVHFLKKQIKR